MCRQLGGPSIGVLLLPRWGWLWQGGGEGQGALHHPPPQPNYGFVIVLPLEQQWPFRDPSTRVCPLQCGR